jgi:hypothetical protein
MKPAVTIFSITIQEKLDLIANFPANGQPPNWDEGRRAVRFNGVTLWW